MEFTDEEVLALYESHEGNASALAPILGVNVSNARKRVAKAKLRFDEKPLILERLMPNVQNVIEHELELGSVPPEGSHISSAWIKGKHVSVHMVPDRASENVPFPVIIPAAPTIVLFNDAPRLLKRIRTIPILSDAQIGFLRDVRTDMLEPSHDLDAIDVALQIVADIQPSELGVIGDWMDLPSLSRWEQYPEYDRTTQPAIDEAHRILAEFKSAAGPRCAKFWMTSGNHDVRFEKYLLSHAKAALGIRRAAAAPDEWPTFSMPFMLRFDELGILYGGQYPGGEYWITDKLAATHAPIKKLEFRASYIHGHLHRITTTSYVQHDRMGREVYSVYDIGCLCRVDSTSSSERLMRTSVPSDRARTDFIQGFGIVEVIDGKIPLHAVSQVHIENGEAIFQGAAYRSRRLLEAA